MTGDSSRASRDFRSVLRASPLWRARIGLGLTVLVLLCGFAAGGCGVAHPFAGVTYIERAATVPRPVKMHIVIIDLATPGLRFFLTGPGGAADTVKETTLQFMVEQKAQVALNAHFFEPWPPPKPDPGTAKLVGLAASNGIVYAPFDAHPPKAFALGADAPALNIDSENRASIVHRNQADPTDKSVAEPVKLYTTLSGSRQVLTGGVITAGTGKWDNTPNPLTVIGLLPGDRLILFTVDGRQAGVSEGLSTREAAELLRDRYGATDAINLDGGGSTTLCLADPTPRVVNVPVGVDNVPGTLRAVGSNLAVFAPRVKE